MHYPKHMEGLLKKAGLLGRQGFLEIRAVHLTKTDLVSEDGQVYNERERPEIEDIARGQTGLIMNNAGQIAGYWANGLSTVERELIHNECGVPYYYMNEPLDKDGRAIKPNTQINVLEGEIFNMQIPAHVAKLKVLLEGTYVGHNRQDALDNDALFYFYSREEEEKEKVDKLKEKKKAIKLIDELNVKQKRQILRIMAYNGDIQINHYMDTDDVPLLFDDFCFELPYYVMKAHNQQLKHEFIMVHTLLSSGHIRAGGKEGPYFKDEVIYGKRDFLYNTFGELLENIEGHKELVKAYNDIESHIKGTMDSNNPYTMPKSAIELLSRHGLVKTEEDEKGDIKVVAEEEDDEHPLVVVINKSSRPTMLKMLQDGGISHSYTSDSDIDELRAFCIEHLT